MKSKSLFESFMSWSCSSSSSDMSPSSRITIRFFLSRCIVASNSDSNSSSFRSISLAERAKGAATAAAAPSSTPSA